MPETRSCRQCNASFGIEDRDEAFYVKMQVPPPTLCPECRLQRRLAWRNERKFYMRKCDTTGKEMLSIFAPDTPYVVYHHETWYNGGWDARTYGRDFDFSRPFFGQYDQLLKSTPLCSLTTAGNQNCEYVHECGWSKNCYMTIEGDNNEDCAYTYRTFKSKTCVDCTEVIQSERCYECADCRQCFMVQYSRLCEQCHDSAFLFDCRSCRHCFCCVGLRQKNYCLFNEQLTEEEYTRRIAQFDFWNRQHLAVASSRLEELKLRHPRKACIGEQNESVSGNYIYESKDCFDSFEIRQCRDCRYCHMIHTANDCMDVHVFGDTAERLYESECVGRNAQNIRFCRNCIEGIYDLTYCYLCYIGTAHCFGCVSLQKAEYCILNKQYAKEEYERLVPKIIEHMKTTGEWGEFFPVELSPHAYNETVAQEHFPLTKEEAARRGWKWRDQLPFTIGKETVSWDSVPEDIAKIPDTITNEILACEATGKNYRITKQELLFYRKFLLPIPRLHPDERHRRRMALRNPRKLWKRPCGKCGVEMETTYQPSRPEVVYCESCYLKAVY